MTLPAGMTYRTVVGKFTDVEPGAVRAITFASPGWLFGDEIVAPFAVELVLTPESDGTFTIELPSTDDPAYVPQPWLYRVKLTGGVNVQRGTLAVPHVGDGDIDLATNLQLPDAAEPGAVYLLANARGVAGGVAALDADGDVTDALGNKITGGEGGAVSWSSITGKPTAFAPSAHAAAHADGGADEVTLTTAQVTGLDARLDALEDAPVPAGSSVVVTRAVLTAGNYAVGADASWTPITAGPTLVVPAVVGDNLDMFLVGMLDHNVSRTDFFEIVVLVGGAIARYSSTGTASPSGSPEGDPAQYPNDRFAGWTSGMSFEVGAGDLSGGSVTFGIAHKGAGGGSLFASNYPLRWRAVNYGQ